MTFEHARPVEIFRAEAGARCPGFLYSFNIADFKRRNCHLGLAVGDTDIADLNRALERLMCETVVAARAHSERWFLFSEHDLSGVVQKVLDDYRRSDKVWAGWRIDGEKPGERAVHERLVEAQIERGIRCLCTPVKSRDDLNAAIQILEENDFDLPVNTIVHVDTIPSLTRKRWSCVTRYPEEDPNCPFCGGSDFAWEGGDMMVYSGYGTCKACEAKIDIRQID